MNKWHNYFMGFARHAATMSKDSTKVGAVLVGPGGEVRLTGFNGPPRGVEDTFDRFQRPRKYLFASHAEQNLIAFAARHGIRTDGCYLYVTHRPCASCMKSIIQAGIVAVTYADGLTQLPSDDAAASITMAKEAGIKMVLDEGVK